MKQSKRGEGLRRRAGQQRRWSHLFPDERAAEVARVMRKLSRRASYAYGRADAWQIRRAEYLREVGRLEP